MSRNLLACNTIFFTSSISSSLLDDAQTATITYLVLEEPSFSGQGKHIGVATSYLSNLKPNDIVYIAVRQSRVASHLPSTTETTPIICIAAGTGLAPFRGFIQKRAAQISAYSREDAEETAGCKYVQDRMMKEREFLDLL